MTSQSLTVALKEWDLLISDLLAGRQAILLRKGGILEGNNEFELEHKQFLFYPTFIHQDPKMVKPERHGEIRTFAAEPREVKLRGYGEVVRIVEVPSRAAMDALSDLHLWDTPLIDMRFNYRAEKPLYLVVVRAFTLPVPVCIPNTLAYAGCKSWVPLEEAVDVSLAHQAMQEEKLQSMLTRITTTFAA